eukprot:CAMPEP_0116906502 /NCGR_PEP_ID=MMETSP0467-20121206/12559_1 /TAXON_ID=283647 /ORGANISM="Mesodinium pulex, Strain SPMC105" /LENGTH=138 /DNA_ID=CAMNT_0004581363 /DNA_START=176 /DNA_END=592 /DNA_ORIENTATION=+
MGQVFLTDESDIVFLSVDFEHFDDVEFLVFSVSTFKHESGGDFGAFDVASLLFNELDAVAANGEGDLLDDVVDGLCVGQVLLEFDRLVEQPLQGGDFAFGPAEFLLDAVASALAERYAHVDQCGSLLRKALVQVGVVL